LSQKLKEEYPVSNLIDFKNATKHRLATFSFQFQKPTKYQRNLEKKKFNKWERSGRNGNSPRNVLKTHFEGGP
jgi:hypothetical protein